MRVIHSPSELRELTREWNRQDQTVALVPTMGALHEGHLSLVTLAQSRADKCIVSIFVNPKQFSPKEDLSKYPRPFEADCEKLKAIGADVVFAPSPTAMYPEGFQTSITLSGISRSLCGSSRPGHFDGVGVVCTKLFTISEAQIAIFGEKDFQQVRVIEQLVSDLNLTVEIVRGALLRDADGLALSSRNVYLSPGERDSALVLSRSLFYWRDAVRPTTTAAEIRDQIRSQIQGAGLRPDYVEICEESDIAPVSGATRLGEMRQPRLFVAAFAGSTRLIDNIALVNATTQGALL